MLKGFLHGGIIGLVLVAWFFLCWVVGTLSFWACKRVSNRVARDLLKDRTKE